MYEVCMLIMTESINLCGIILLTYFLSLIYLGKGNARIIWLVSAILLFLVLLRPFNIVFIPISLLVIFAAYRKHRFIHLRTTGVSISTTLSVIFGYCLWFKIVYGTFSLSYVSTVNQLYNLEKLVEGGIGGSSTERVVTIGNRQCLIWMWHNRDCSMENIIQALHEEYKKFAYSHRQKLL